MIEEGEMKGLLKFRKADFVFFDNFSCPLPLLYPPILHLHSFHSPITYTLHSLPVGFYSLITHSLPHPLHSLPVQTVKGTDGTAVHIETYSGPEAGSAVVGENKGSYCIILSLHYVHCHDFSCLLQHTYDF